MKVFDRLQTRLNIIFIVLAVVPLFFVSLVISQRSVDLLRDDVEVQLRERSRHIAADIDTYIAARTRTLEYLAEDNLRHGDEPAAFLSSIFVFDPAFERIVLLDSDGMESAQVSRSGTASPDVDRSDSPEYTAIVSGASDAYYSDMHFDENLHEPLMTLSLPVCDQGAEVIESILVADVHFRPVWQLLAEYDYREGETAYVLDTEGAVVAHRDPSIVLRGTVLPVPAERSGMGQNLQGDDVLYGSHTITFGSQTFIVVAEQTTQHALELARDTQLVTGGVLVVALIAVAGLAVFVVRHLVSPLEHMTRTVQAIMDGDLSQRTQVRGQSEIGVLAGAFNRLIDDLERQVGELRQAEERYRTVADFNTVWTYWEKPDGSIQYVSPACQSITGYTPAQIRENPGLIASLILEADCPTWDAHRHDPTDGPGPQSISFRLRHKDGSVRWIEHTCCPVFNAAGDFDGYRVSNSDITYLKESESELRFKENTLAVALQAAHAGVWTWDSDSDRLHWDSAMESLYGIEPGSFDGSNDTWVNRVHPDDVERVMAEVAITLRDHTPISTEYRIVRPDGAIRYVHAQAVVIAGNRMQVIGINRDITERKLIEIDLRESEQRYRMLADLAFEGIVLHDNGVILDSNPAITRMFGYEREELIGQYVIDRMFTPESAQVIREKVRLYHAQPYEVVARRRDGTEFPVQIEARQLRPDLRVASLRDITEQKQHEAFALQNQRLKVRFQQEQDKNAFIQRIIAMLSHDMRTPLAVIQSSRDLLDRYFNRLSDDSRQEKLDTIGRQVQFVLEMLEDTVNMARGNLSEGEFHPAPVNLAALCQVSVNEIAVARDGNHTMLFLNRTGVETATVDEVLVSRMLINLLSNAIKYSPDGGEIRVELDADGDAVILRVIDHGIGIAPEDLPQIFNTFYRADEVRHISGTGLGLSIVMDCVERHGGDISVESTPGQGSVFTVRLPGMR